MARIALIAVFVAALGFISAVASQRPPEHDLNPEGQPQGLKAGVPHRYYVWHDAQGWHLRTTTARERHRFHGEVIADDGAIRDMRTYRAEHGDWAQVDQNNRRIFFDLSTDEGLDGFDFLTDSQNVRFRLLMDGKERPELVYVGLTGNNPRTLPFAVANPDAKSKTPVVNPVVPRTS